MVQITLDLLHKRAEHNDGEIHTLEEVSLHQERIEKLEMIDKWCPKLKILLLQSNLIPKIENLSRLKQLQYLNLALNNIELIENLEALESLKKLDLTVNFIGEITSAETLEKNSALEELYMNGNPCTDFVGYRQYIIAVVPQIKSLDGKDVTKSERILALQEFEEIEIRILQQQEQHRMKRREQKTRAVMRCQEMMENPSMTVEELDKKYWEEPTEFTPESRIEAERMMENLQSAKVPTRELYPKDRKRALFARNNRPLNVNEASLNFEFREDEYTNAYKLEVMLYKHLETSLVDVNLARTYVRVTVKGKVLQLVLPEPIRLNKCKSTRSKTTGHLLINMPKVHGKPRPKTPPPPPTLSFPGLHPNREVVREILQIGRRTRRYLNVHIIYREVEVPSNSKQAIPNVPNSPSFSDNAGVPPLEPARK